MHCFWVFDHWTVITHGVSWLNYLFPLPNIQSLNLISFWSYLYSPNSLLDNYKMIFLNLKRCFQDHLSHPYIWTLRMNVIAMLLYIYMFITVTIFSNSNFPAAELYKVLQFPTFSLSDCLSLFTLITILVFII